MTVKWLLIVEGVHSQNRFASVDAFSLNPFRTAGFQTAIPVKFNGLHFKFESLKKGSEAGCWAIE